MDGVTRAIERKKTMDQVTGWISKRLGVKRRLQRLKQIDHRQSESRVTEDALLYYLPILEQRLLPTQEEPHDQSHAVGS